MTVIQKTVPKKFIGILLSLAMVLGLMPGMSLQTAALDSVQPIWIFTPSNFECLITSGNNSCKDITKIEVLIDMKEIASDGGWGQVQWGNRNSTIRTESFVNTPGIKKYTVEGAAVSDANFAVIQVKGNAILLGCVVYRGDNTSSYGTMDVPELTAPTAKTGLKSTGSPLALVTPGTTTGTIEYSLDKNDWSTDVPTGVESGNYTVYYRLKYDEGEKIYTPLQGNDGITVSISDNQTTPAPPAPPAHTHTWKTPVYTWSDDNTTVTAGRICKDDPSHKESETVSVTSEIIKEPTYTDTGIIQYTSGSFANSAFEVQTRTDFIPKLVPNYKEPVYTWSDDNSSVTAYCECIEEPSLSVTETVNTSSLVTKPADCLNKGETTYTAVFKSELFTQQTKTADDIPALGHAWGEWETVKEPTYYAEGEKQRVCLRDPSHIESISIPVKDAVYFTVYFDTSGGSAVPSEVVHDGNKAFCPNDPSKYGSKFRYWALNGVKYDFNTPVTSDITLTAVWDNSGISSETSASGQFTGYISPTVTVTGGYVNTQPAVQPAVTAVRPEMTVSLTEENSSLLTWEIPDAVNCSLYVYINGSSKFIQNVSSNNVNVLFGTDGKWYVSDNGGDFAVYEYKNGRFVNTGTLPADKAGEINIANNLTHTFMVKYTKADGTVSSAAESCTASVKVYYKPAVRAAVNGKKVTLKWNPVPGAEKYRIYKVNNGKRTLLAETDKASASVLTKGGENTYAVSAVINGEETKVLKSDLVTVNVK